MSIVQKIEEIRRDEIQSERLFFDFCGKRPDLLDGSHDQNIRLVY